MAKENRPPGRPPKGDEPQAARLYLRAVDEEKNLFEAAAEAAGVSLSEWIRDRLVKAAKKETKRSK
jgi:uncharacterized protein (DUF1778 family)